MQNATVKELIEILSKLDQDAIVCHVEWVNDHPFYSSFETCYESKLAEYIDDAGDVKVGNIVAIG